MTRYYAGIGARKTPDEVLLHMTNAAAQLSDCDLILRSGGATGADSAFELGAAKDKKEIFIPWHGFNGRYTDEPGVIAPDDALMDKAMDLASRFHPAWDKLTGPTHRLMARNAFQILGPLLDSPVLFVLCWTPSGKGQGGTGQAIRMANALDIPVFDMGKMSLNEISDQVNQII